MKNLFLLCAVVPFGVWAQDGSLWGDETKVSVGLGLGATPEYVGAQDFRLAALPHVRVSRGIFFADVRQGVGVQYRNAHGFAVRSSVAYDAGRDEKRGLLRPGSARLQGMGKVEGSAVWNVALAQEVMPGISVHGEGNVHLGGQKNRGHDFRVGVEGKVLENPRDTVKVHAQVHGGDGDFNQTYFGVTAAQAAGSGFRPHRMRGGVYGVSAGASWERKWDDHWTVGANVRVLQLTGDAADSPIVGRKTQAAVMTTVRYDF